MTLKLNIVGNLCGVDQKRLYMKNNIECWNQGKILKNQKCFENKYFLPLFETLKNRHQNLERCGKTSPLGVKFFNQIFFVFNFFSVYLVITFPLNLQFIILKGVDESDLLLSYSKICFL